MKAKATKMATQTKPKGKPAPRKPGSTKPKGGK